MEKSQIQTLPGIQRLEHKFCIFIQSPCILALFTHLSHEMSMSRCVQHWQISAYVKQEPTLFEVLFYRLPHFTTDSLSHSCRCSGIWSCNMNTCIQTWEHSRKYKLCYHSSDTYSRSDFSLSSGLSLESEAFSYSVGFVCFQIHWIWNCSIKKSTICYHQQCLMFCMLISSLTNWNVLFLSWFVFHPACLLQKLSAITADIWSDL